MIESITIGDTPPFNGGQPASMTPRKLNYIFGTNGVGKTTISRVIADPTSRAGCSLTWIGGRQLETLVLNRDFVDRNFGQLKGIFTLGEEQKDTRAKIEAARQARQEEIDNRDQLRRTLEGNDGNGGKRAELASLEDDIKQTCWRKTRSYDKRFQEAFAGCRDSKGKLKATVLDKWPDKTGDVKPLEELTARAETVFGTTPTEATPAPTIDASTLLDHESAPILEKKVIGKKDVDIAAMIERLSNSDWVRQGREFYKANHGICPFCQKKTTEAFTASLEAYFDDTYERDKKAIDLLVTTYASDVVSLQNKISDILATPGNFVDMDRLEAQKSVLDEAIRANRLLLGKKQESPSQVVTLQSLAGVIKAIKDIIDAANTKINEHNRTVANLASEKRTLKAQVWRLVLDELETDLERYDNQKPGLDKAIAHLESQIKATATSINAKESEIRELERQTTSIQPTVNAINDILGKFGFTSFKLAMADDGRSYRLVRPDGEEARETLSEGEKTFVVFLYFYQLLKGSMSENGITADRIVVFDDPVSSLDSDVLFIVSSLIRGVCEDTCQGLGRVKQVFVFTHNVYFHREVTFPSHGKDIKKADRLFGIVRKCDGDSWIEVVDENPIKTSYDMLWADVRKAEPNSAGIENTLRRILEYYFQILGGTQLYKLPDEFDGNDKLICKSLLSWVNAGSHHVLDPLFVTPSDTSAENYLRIFRAIFEKSGHPGHYRMMMGDDFVAAPEETDNAQDKANASGISPQAAT